MLTGTIPYHHRKKAEQAEQETREWLAAGNRITKVPPEASAYKQYIDGLAERARRRHEREKKMQKKRYSQRDQRREREKAERDEMVLSLVGNDWTTNLDIAATLGLSAVQVWWSLRRLHEAGKLEISEKMYNKRATKPTHHYRKRENDE